MNKTFSFTIKKQSEDSSARTGEMQLAHGAVQTPIFMPCGTKGVVKALTKEELEDIGAEIILGNTYHLYLRPGPQLIKDFGGLHKFSGWKRNMLTDSGGFQVFSLGQGNRDTKQKLVKITEDGVEFRSYIDGSKHFFSPESVMEIEGQIGGDIMMAFDECAPADAPRKYIEDSVELTHRWAVRSVDAYNKVQKQREQDWGDAFYPQVLFPIVQGGIEEDLRKKSAKFIAGLDMPGNAIGGLSVGESKEHMYGMLDVVNDVLPKDKPRYLMGVGTPEDLLEGVSRGVDMFDCVLPTRLGRHGTIFTATGRISITKEEFKKDTGPLDKDCTCKMCAEYSRAYVRHIFMEKEITALRILSYHNVYFLVDLMKQIRAHIEEGDFESWKASYLERLFSNT